MAGKVPVQFVRKWPGGVWNAGEVAGFDQATAAKLIKDKYAMPFEKRVGMVTKEAEPEETPEAKKDGKPKKVKRKVFKKRT